MFVDNILKVLKGYLPIILYIPVLHSGQVPFMAFLPFFIVTSFGSFISLLDLHFTQ